MGTVKSKANEKEPIKKKGGNQEEAKEIKKLYEILGKSEEVLSDLMAERQQYEDHLSKEYFAIQQRINDEGEVIHYISMAIADLRHAEYDSCTIITNKESAESGKKCAESLVKLIDSI